jgi:hypothetical protein
VVVWRRLPADWLTRYGPQIAMLLAARGADGEVAAHARPALADLYAALETPPPPELAGLSALLRDFVGLPRARLPDDLRAELRDYQRRGVDWLCLLRDAGLGAMLADDMGLGKTLQCLCALRGRCLIVAPTSVLFNWAAEARRFRPGLRVCTYHGPRRRLDPEADLVLTSYAILRLDAEALAAESWDAVVLDEAQTIKNPDSQVARAAYGLTRARWRVTLSGTPVENRLEELWSQFHFVMPGLLGGRQDFSGEARAADRGGACAGRRSGCGSSSVRSCCGARSRRWRASCRRARRWCCAATSTSASGRSTRRCGRRRRRRSWRRSSRAGGC